MNPSEKPPVPDGWNDPPANLALSENMTTKRVLLNKRVPYTNQNLSATTTNPGTDATHRHLSELRRHGFTRLSSVECSDGTANIRVAASGSAGSRGIVINSNSFVVHRRDQHHLQKANGQIRRIGDYRSTFLFDRLVVKFLFRLEKSS